MADATALALSILGVVSINESGVVPPLRSSQAGPSVAISGSSDAPHFLEFMQLKDGVAFAFPMPSLPGVGMSGGLVMMLFFPLAGLASDPWVSAFIIAFPIVARRPSFLAASNTASV